MLIHNCVSLYGRELYRLCYSLCRNTYDADDLYQETWAKAIASEASLEKASDRRKWLFTVCCNAYRDMYRRRKRENAVAFDSTEHMERFFESLPDKSAEAGQDYALLYRAVDALPVNLRTAVSLRFFSSLSEEEVAETLGISYSAARARISRAVKKLSSIMNGEQT